MSDCQTCPVCKRKTHYMAPNALRCGHCLDELTSLGRNPALVVCRRDVSGALQFELLDPVPASEKQLSPRQRRDKLRLVVGGL